MKLRFFLFLLLVSLLACTPVLKPEGHPPSPESVKSILLHIAPDNLDASGLASFSRQVARNLAGWGYAVMDENADTRAAHTHLMQVMVGRIERQETPVGFSFGMGHSDPRSPDFQRAEVLPVTCSLESIKDHGVSARMTVRFVAEDILKTQAPDPSGARQGVWVNHIGTACFNLLSKLDIGRGGEVARKIPSSSAWIPEVRIEVSKKHVPNAPAERDKAAVTASPATEAPQDPASASLETQSRIRDDDGRKQIIIHNQGSPVILEFGYERK